VAGNVAYVADGPSGLHLVNVSNPSSPQIIGSVDTPNYAWCVAVAGDIAYVADGYNSFQIIDVSNPSSPQKIGSLLDTKGDAYHVVVAGGMAYVAGLGSGLKVIDVTDPRNPQFKGSVDTPGYAYSVFVAGTMAYVADSHSGLQIIDVSNPSSPQIIGSVSTLNTANDVDVIGTTAFVADRIGLTIVPVPTEIQHVIVNNVNSITLTLPTPVVTGQYNLRVSNNTESDELLGAVTFMKAEDYQEQIQKRAIVVAGYRSYPDDALWTRTQKCANMAYRALSTQGYSKDNIYYLSPEPYDVDGDGVNDVDDDASHEKFSYALQTWARGTNELVLFMTDHGGTETFQLNNNYVMSAEDLDSWLDDVQSTISDGVICVYDACKSGSFIPTLTPPSGKKRIVITSTTEDEYAWFENEGVLSFSYQFWARLMLDAYLSKAFNVARNMMLNDQTALLDANGNGVANEKEDNIADIILGRGRVAGATPPTIHRVSEAQTHYGATSASFWARDVSGLNPIVRVWAVIVTPDERPANVPITDFDTVDLTGPDQDGVYNGSYNNFSSVGLNRVLIYAEDEDGGVSMPAQTTVYQAGPDGYEDDDSFSKASVIVLNDVAQRHNFHDAGDEDLIRFFGISGEKYTIAAYNLGTNCDAIIKLYGTDGTTLIKSQDTIGDPHADEFLEWTCNKDGLYYAKVKDYENGFGDGMDYDLKAYRPPAPLAGFVMGKVTDGVSGQAVGDVKIRTDQGASALSLTNGSYVMVHPPGTFTVTAQLAHYNPRSYTSVQINEGDIKTINIVLDPSPTDTDKDGILDAVEYASSCLDANDADSDNDGIVDGQEDKDSDGIFDPGETDPCDLDTDGDQMPDGWEVQYNLNPLVDDASEDADGDGYSNLKEHRGGSDPTDQFSLPQIRSLPWLPLLLLED
jgi:hypothetical protein